MCQSTRPTALEGFQKRGVVLAQQGAELVGDLLVRLGARHIMPLTVARHRQRIDRVHLSSGATKTGNH